MDLIAGLNELIAQMEEDIAAHDSLHASCVIAHVRSLKMLIKAATPKTVYRHDDEAGVSVSIGGSTTPQQPPPPERPFKANKKPRDPWEEAQRKAPRRLTDEETKRQIIGDLDKPFHRPECQCDQCEEWRSDNGRKPYRDAEDEHEEGS
jgi:hypothetical protein